jgi:hypothetical protein
MTTHLKTNKSREEIFDFLNTRNTIALSDKISRCDHIERYMKTGCDNYKLLDLFFACGNASFFEEEIKCYFKILGRVDSELALGKEYSVTTGTGGFNFDFMIFDNITVYTSIGLFEYIFSMVTFDRESLCYFLKRSIEVQLKESARARQENNLIEDRVKGKNIARLVEFFISQINATERPKRPRENDYTVQRPLKFIKIY